MEEYCDTEKVVLVLWGIFIVTPLPGLSPSNVLLASSRHVLLPSPPLGCSSVAEPLKAPKKVSRTEGPGDWTEVATSSPALVSGPCPSFRAHQRPT